MYITKYKLTCGNCKKSKLIGAGKINQKTCAILKCSEKEMINEFDEICNKFENKKGE